MVSSISLDFKKENTLRKANSKAVLPRFSYLLFKLYMRLFRMFFCKLKCLCSLGHYFPVFLFTSHKRKCFVWLWGQTERNLEPLRRLLYLVLCECGGGQDVDLYIKIFIHWLFLQYKNQTTFTLRVRFKSWFGEDPKMQLS